MGQLLHILILMVRVFKVLVSHVAMVIPVVISVAIPKIVMAVRELLLHFIVGIRTAVIAAQLTLVSLILVSVMILVSHKHHPTVLTVLEGRLRLSTWGPALQLPTKELFDLVEIPVRYLGHILYVLYRLLRVSILAHWSIDTEAVHVVIALPSPCLPKHALKVQIGHADLTTLSR